MNKDSQKEVKRWSDDDYGEAKNLQLSLSIMTCQGPPLIYAHPLPTLPPLFIYHGYQ